MEEDKKRLYEDRRKRYLAAMNLEKPDKVPITLFVSEYMARNAGYTLQEIYYQQSKNFESGDKYLENHDVDAFGGAPSLWWAGMHDATNAKYLKFAGRELESNTQFQFVEGEYMLADDYDRFIDNPTEWINQVYMPRLMGEMETPGSFRANSAIIKGAMAMAMNMGMGQQAWARWTEEYGAVPFFTGMSKAPFDTLGDTLRGLKGIMTDMRRRPDKLLAAMDVLVGHNVYYGMATAAGDTDYPLFMPLHRGSYPFLNPKQWDEFYWPTFKKVIETFWSYGKRVLFYAEGNWTPYLEKIAELPEKSIIFHVDMTDMAEAKAVLGKKFCISGNVPNSLLAFGTPEEVKKYVKDLLDKYAGDGGFILDSAAVIESDAEVANIQAMIEAGREYGIY